MRRLTTFARGSHIPAATLDGMQDRSVALAPASAAPATLLTGADGRWWTTTGLGVEHGTAILVDASLDWRGRRIWGTWRRLPAATWVPGGADDYRANDPAEAVATRRFDGWTGTGALATGGDPIDDGAPPVHAAGSYPVVIDELTSAATRVWLFADPSDGHLWLYNASGAWLHGTLLVFGAGTAPAASAPPPDLVPTLTEVQWLTPSAAADRPADPGGPAIHRATDTGLISLWDGGAWRDLT